MNEDKRKIHNHTIFKNKQENKEREMGKGNEESLRRIRRSSEVLSVRIENIERRRDDRSSNSSYEEDKGYEEDEGGRRKGEGEI